MPSLTGLTIPLTVGFVTQVLSACILEAFARSYLTKHYGPSVDCDRGSALTCEPSICRLVSPGKSTVRKAALSLLV